MTRTLQCSRAWTTRSHQQREIDMRSILRALAGMVLLSRAGWPLAHAQTCVVPLVNVGPTDPVHGFPQYYIGAANAALQPGLGGVCNPARGLPARGGPGGCPDSFRTR